MFRPMRHKHGVAGFHPIPAHLRRCGAGREHAESLQPRQSLRQQAHLLTVKDKPPLRDIGKALCVSFFCHLTISIRFGIYIIRSGSRISVVCAAQAGDEVSFPTVIRQDTPAEGEIGMA